MIMRTISACACLLIVAGMLWPAGSEVISGEFLQKTVLTGFLQAEKAEHLVVPRSNSWQVQIKWMAPEGSNLKAGDVAVRFDTANLASEIENLELTLEDKLELKKQKEADCRMERKSLTLELEMAQIDVKKKALDAGIPKGLIPDYDYEKYQLELKKSKEACAEAKTEKDSRFSQMTSELERLNIEIEEARSKLNMYETMLAGLTLHSGSGGTLMYAEHPWHRRKLQIGDNVGVTWTVATIPDNSTLYVEAWALESGVKSLAPGQRVDIVLDAYPNKNFGGVIEDVMNNAEKKNRWGRAYYFRVKIKLDALDPRFMKPGMSVKCEVTLNRVEQALLVPLEMVCCRGADFWIQTTAHKPVKIKAGLIGKNDFFLALDSQGPVSAGARLEPVDVQQIQEAADE